MTTVYGVTFIGARDQIEKQIRERTNIPPELRFNVASYTAKQVSSCFRFFPYFIETEDYRRSQL